MKRETLAGELREEFRKGYTKELRRNGKIPSVMYGHTESVSLSVDEHEFNSKFKMISENIIINLNVSGKNYDVLVKDFQEDFLTGKILHLDFYEIEKGKHLKTHVPLHTHGTPDGVRVDGGLFEVFLHEVEVDCLPKDLPDEIVVEVSGLNVGHSIHIRDIQPPEGVRFLNPHDQVICIVTRKREIIEEAPKEEVVAEGEEVEKEEENAEEE